MHFQNGIRELTNGDANAERLAFRVGISIGDVIVEADDIFGERTTNRARWPNTISALGSAPIKNSCRRG